MNSSNIFSGPSNLGFNSVNPISPDFQIRGKALPQMRLESTLKQLGEAYSSQAAAGIQHNFSLCLDHLTPLTLNLGAETHEVLRNSADGSVILSEELEGRADEVHQALRHHGYEGVKLVFINSALFKDLTNHVRSYQAAQAAKAREEDQDLNNEQEVEPTPPISRRQSFEIKNHSLTEEERALLLYMARIKITHIGENILFADERARMRKEQEKQEQKVELLKTEQRKIEAGEKEVQDARILESIKQNGARSENL